MSWIYIKNFSNVSNIITNIPEHIFYFFPYIHLLVFFNINGTINADNWI